MVKGLDVFADFFAGDEAHYVLIGGVATQLVLEDVGLPARATKDLDIVLCIEALNTAFGEKLWAFIAQGGYDVRQQGEAPRRFYRFAKPGNAAFPHMLEFFAREPGHLPLAPGTHLTPVPINEAVVSLSAILLNQDYYAYLQAHTRQLAGVRIVTEEALIPLKVRAWLDLAARRAADPISVDARHVHKHRGDILRLSQLLTEGQSIDAPAVIVADLASFIDQVRDEVNEALLHSLGIRESPQSTLSRLRGSFRMQR